MSLAVNAVVAGLAVFVIAAASIWYLTVDRQRDQVKVLDVGHEWVTADEVSERIRVEVTFENRYNVEAELLGWRYELQVHRQRIAFAENTETAMVRPNGQVRSALMLDVPKDFVSSWVQGHTTGDEQTQARFVGEAVFEVSHRNLTVNFGPSVEWSTNLRGSLEEIENCPQPEPDPCVIRADARWETQGESTILRLLLDVNNPTDDPLVLEGRSAELVWGSTPVGRADAHEEITVPAGGSESMEFRIYLVHELLKDWWVGHVNRCESSPTALRLAFAYHTDPPEPAPTPTPTPTTSSSPTSATPSPTPTTSSPTSSSPTTTSPESSPTETSPTETSDSDSPASKQTRSVAYSTFILVEPILQLQPGLGETGDVNWEFAGPLLRTEFVCSRD